MLDFSRVNNLVWLISQIAEVEGDIVEFGCHRGCTAILLKTLTSKDIWLYDSFSGLPQPSLAHDGDRLKIGDMKAPAIDVLNKFQEAGFRCPKVFIKYFEELFPSDLPDKIAFAHLDGDLYRSIIASLRLVYPKLSPGAICVIDDYANPMVLGVKPAVDHFMADKVEAIVQTNSLNGEKAVQCYFIKK